ADERAVASVVGEVWIEVRLRAELGTAVALLASDLVRRAGVHRLDGCELLRGEDVFAGRAELVDVEAAGARVRDLSVDEAIVRVAGLEHAIRDQVTFRGAQGGRLSKDGRQLLARPEQPEQDVGVEHRGRSDDDAVE